MSERSTAAVHLAPMADGQQVDRVLCRVERVDDAVVADTETVSVAAGQTIMWVAAETETHLVNHGFNAMTERGRQLQKDGVERRVVDLERRSHGGTQGWRTRGRTPSPISRSDF